MGSKVSTWATTPHTIRHLSQRRDRIKSGVSPSWIVSRSSYMRQFGLDRLRSELPRSIGTSMRIMAQDQLMLFTKVCVTQEALEVMGRQGMTLEKLLTLPKARWEDLHEWGIYIDIVKLANGELDLYVGSGTDSKHELKARWGVYGRANSTGYSAQEGLGLHLEHALRPGSTINLRLIAILPPRSHRALAILLEGILMIFLRSINRHKAQQVSIRNTQSMSTFVLSHNAMNIAATWKGLNGACALGQGCQLPFGFKSCSTCGEGFGDTHPTRCLSHFSYATTEVLGFHPRCLLEYRHALKRQPRTPQSSAEV